MANSKQFFGTLIGVLIVVMATLSVCAGEYFPESAVTNVKDYGYMWWAYGWRDARKVVNFQTSRYALSFNYPAFKLLDFKPLLNALPESEALVQTNESLFSAQTVPPVALECTIENDGTRYKATGASSDASNCKLIECGKYFNRRWLEAIAWQPGAPALTLSRLEIASWPDRVAFVLHVTPTAALTNGAIEVSLSLDAVYSTLLSSGAARALAATDGSGFVFVADDTGAILSVDAASQKCTVRLAPGAWAAGQEKAVTLIAYPVAADCQTVLERANAGENTPMTISASQVAPSARTLTASYDRTYGWYYVTLRNENGATYQESSNNRIERVTVTLTNPDSTPREARLNFGKEDNVACVTGISAMIRDTNQNPTGVPVQLSKDWHGWTWFHGLTMMTVPANSSLTFEYTGVNAHWGLIPAAAHAQLCLVGWGVNQQWDQASIGSWGESITFDPDVNLNRSMIDDVRPLMVYQMNSNTQVKWAWTNNVGGGDFLLYYNKSGQKQWNSRMRTMFRRYCPDMTEVSYAGRSQDQKIDLKCTVTLYRTNDINRGIYHVRYDILEPVSFNRLAFAQIASDNYNDHQFNKMARGNENGLIEEWTPARGGSSYSRIGIRSTGAVPWFSMHEAISNDTSAYGAWANRGMIIRSWHARLNGVIQPPSYVSVYGTNNGPASALVELAPPPGQMELKAGDYVDAEIEHVIVPQYQHDYYGGNAQLTAALGQWENTWRLIYREAIGNHLDISVTSGTLERSYPIRIHADAQSRAVFSVAGGLGYVPMTFVGLGGYADPLLEMKSGEIWSPINQANYGKDYWQTDYDPVTKQWQVTYTVPLDTAGDARQTREFRFGVTPLSGHVTSTPTPAPTPFPTPLVLEAKGWGNY